VLDAAGGPTAGQHLHHHPPTALRAVARRLELTPRRAGAVVASDGVPALVAPGFVVHHPPYASRVTVQPGAQAVVRHQVTPDDTARALGSGDLQVLATPRLLAWCEQATVQALAGRLAESESTVGIRVELTHQRATAVGAEVTVRADLVHVDGRLLRFDVVAEADDGTVLGHGRVTRVVVDRARFLARL
jgi:fluoroacetyl-CoA thioesterase